MCAFLGKDSRISYKKDGPTVNIGMTPLIERALHKAKRTGFGCGSQVGKVSACQASVMTSLQLLGPLTKGMIQTD